MSVLPGTDSPNPASSWTVRSVHIPFAVSDCYANAAMVRKRKADGQSSVDSGSTDWISELFHQQFAASDGFQVIRAAVSTPLLCKSIVVFRPATRRTSVLTLSYTVQLGADFLAAQTGR